MAWAKIYAYPRVIEKIRAAAHPGLSLAFRTDTEEWSCPPGALDARVAHLDAAFTATTPTTTPTTRAAFSTPTRTARGGTSKI